jgi:HEAT repeat protein
VRLREQSAKALGDIKDAAAVEPLIAISLREGNPTVRISAINALGKIKDARATEPLISLLDNKTFQVRDNATEALGEIADPRAIDPLLAVIRRNRAEGVPAGLAQWHGVQALGRIGGPAVGQLTQAAKDPDKIMRLGAVSALSGIKDPRVVEPLIIALSDEDIAIRAAAAKGLAWSEDPRAAEPVMTALKDKEKEVRENAVEGLCWNHSAWVIDPIIATMRDPESGFAARCLNAAQQNIQAPITGPFIVLLKDPDERVRGLAAEALSQSLTGPPLPRSGYRPEDAPTLKALESALQDNNTAAVYGAFSFFIGLGKPGSEAALIEALDEYGDKWTVGYVLTCGNAKLEEAGRAWLTKRNMRHVDPMTGPVWGSVPEIPQTAGTR